MRQLFAVALALMVVAAPACAQRGGARGGGSSGFRGGFSGRGAGVSRGGYSQAGPSRYAGGARFQSYRPSGRVFAPSIGASNAHFRGTGISNARPAFYDRGRGGRGERGRGIPYVYPGQLNYGWVDSGYLGYPEDDGFYGDDSVNGSVDDSGAAAENYVEQPQARYDQPAPEESAQASNVAPSQSAAPALYDSDAVTLVFKDGRPVQTIHNYALTRTMLYVTDARHREIPVADLDLAATARVNREAGVNFQLPQLGQ